MPRGVFIFASRTKCKAAEALSKRSPGYMEYALQVLVHAKNASVRMQRRYRSRFKEPKTIKIRADIIFIKNRFSNQPK